MKVGSPFRAIKKPGESDGSGGRADQGASGPASRSECLLTPEGPSEPLLERGLGGPGAGGRILQVVVALRVVRDVRELGATYVFEALGSEADEEPIARLDGTIPDLRHGEAVHDELEGASVPLLEAPPVVEDEEVPAQDESQIGEEVAPG